MPVTLEQAKNHLRVDQSETIEDSHIEMLIDAAHAYAEKYLNRAIPWDGEPVPASVTAAMLLVIGDLYENREGQVIGSAVENNPAVEKLLHFHRVEIGI